MVTGERGGGGQIPPWPCSGHSCRGAARRHPWNSLPQDGRRGGVSRPSHPNSSRSGHMVCVASGGRAGARQGLSDLRRRSGSRSVLGLHPGLCGPLPPIAPHLHTPGVVGHVPHEEGGVGRTEVARHGAGEGGGRGEEPDRRRDDPPASRPQPLRKPPQIRPPCGPTLARPPLKSTPS